MRRPFHDSAASYYLVNIVESGTAATITVGSDSEGEATYINVSLAYSTYVYQASLASGNSAYDRYRGVLAHEYMHAILHRYKIGGAGQIAWMHESFASWAGCVYESSYTQYHSGNVSRFITNSGYPLDEFSTVDNDLLKSRHYGSLVFPLYIYQRMGGCQTIKKILELYSNSTSPFNAIANGLEYYGYSFEDAVAGCWTYCYAPSFFYDISSEEWDAEPTHEYGADDYPYSSNMPNELLPTACQYLDFTVPENTMGNLTITLDFLDSGTDELYLRIMRTTSTGEYYWYSSSLTNNRRIISISGVGALERERVALILINASSSQTLSFDYTASMEYTPVDGGAYSLQNIGSGKFLNVHYGKDANGTNVYQWAKDGSVEQNFLLESVSSEDFTQVWYIRAMCSSNGTNRVLDIVKSGGSLLTGCNVQIYNPVDEVAQLWVISRVKDECYTIKPAYASSLALTVYGTANGSSNGTGSTSAGNAFVSTYTGSEYQLWRLVPSA